MSDRIKLAEVLDEIQVKIYEEFYACFTDIYDRLACKYFIEEEPYHMDYLLDCFMEVRTQTLLDFDLSKKKFHGEG